MTTYVSPRQAVPTLASLKHRKSSDTHPHSRPMSPPSILPRECNKSFTPAALCPRGFVKTKSACWACPLLGFGVLSCQALWAIRGQVYWVGHSLHLQFP